MDLLDVVAARELGREAGCPGVHYVIPFIV
jgi:hypothetical protein